MTAERSVSGGEVRRLGAVWWRAVRPFSFTASVTPVLVGSAIAFAGRHFDSGLFVITLVATVAIHAATNLVNDYYDHLRGVDTAASVGPSGVIQHGLLPPRAVLMGALGLFSLGGLLGLLLVAVVGWPVLIIGIVSLLAGYAYTGGPLPLGYLGLGDFVVLVFMGPVIVLGSYYVQARTVVPAVLWVSVPIGALVTAILVVNNLRDLQGDRAHGKRTLATVLGPAGTRVEYLGLLVGAYTIVGIGVALRVLPLLAVLVVLTLPHAFRAWRVIREESDPLSLTRAGLRGTAGLHLRFGLLLSLAFLMTPPQ